VAFANLPGSYAELVAIPGDRAVSVPLKMSFEQAAALMLQGMTARHLVFDTRPLRSATTSRIRTACGSVPPRFSAGPPPGSCTCASGRSSRWRTRRKRTAGWRQG